MAVDRHRARRINETSTGKEDEDTDNQFALTGNLSDLKVRTRAQPALCRATGAMRWTAMA